MLCTGLTQLAFFFIPLSFVSSFFGMNVDEFGSDNGIKLWMFFVTSITLTSVVLIIWGLVAGMVQGICRAYYDKGRSMLYQASKMVRDVFRRNGDESRSNHELGLRY